MKIYKKKWLLEIRRMSGIRSHCQRKRRIEGKCYYKWRAFNKAHNKFIMSHCRNCLLEAFAIPATEDDELARDLINEVALSQRRVKDDLVISDNRS